MNETAQQYITRILGYVEGQQPMKVQQATPKKLALLIKGLNKKQLTHKPALDKWSIAEIITHLADAELVGAWRMRQILGSNGTPIAAYDQEVWAKTFNYSKCDARTSLETFRAVREANLRMLKALPKNLWDNYGVHQERGKETITRVVQMFAGHDLNHLQQVQALAKGTRR